MSTDDAHEQGYTEGRRRTLINQIARGLQDLIGFEDKDGDEALLMIAKLTTERQETVAALRDVCKEHNITAVWSDDLHLADVVNKIIVRHFERR